MSTRQEAPCCCKTHCGNGDGNCGGSADIPVGIRKALQDGLPGWMQPGITWMTGAAPIGSKPPAFMESDWFKRLAPWWYAGSKFFGTLAGQACAAGIIYAVGTGLAPVEWAALLPAAYCLSLGSARGLQVETIHQSVHLTNTGNEIADIFLAEAASGVALCNSPERYYVDHITKHHSTDLCSMKDADVQFLYGVVGLEPGLPKKELQRRLALAFVSPAFHFKFMKARLKGVFNNEDVPLFLKRKTKKKPDGTVEEATIESEAVLVGVVKRGAALRKASALGLHLGIPVAALFVSIGLGNPWLILAVLLGCTLSTAVLYAQVALAHFCGEHYWEFRPIQEEGKPFREAMLRKTSARFHGEAPPKTEGLSRLQAIALWGAFAIKMVGFHLPMRFVISASSLPWHDQHHPTPAHKGWIQGAWWRAQAVAKSLLRSDSGESTYTENWGFFKQIDVVLTSISNLPPFTAEERTAADATCRGKDAEDTFCSM